MLREFRKHNDATNATNAINAVYPGALDTREHISVGLNDLKTVISIFVDGIRSGGPVYFHFKIALVLHRKGNGKFVRKVGENCPSFPLQ